MADNLAELLSGESAPLPRAPVSWMVLLAVGIAMTVGLLAFVLLVIIPEVANVIAWILQVAPSLTTP